MSAAPPVLSPDEVRDLSTLIVNRVFGRNTSDADMTKVDRDLIDTKINAVLLEVEDAISACIEEKIEGAVARLIASSDREEWW